MDKDPFEHIKPPDVNVGFNVPQTVYNRSLGFSHHVPKELEYMAEKTLISKDYTEHTCKLPDSPRSTFLMVFSPDGTKVASTHGNHNVYVTELTSKKNVRTLSGHPRTPWCIAFHPSSNQILASGCLGGQVRVWDLHGGSEIWMTDSQTVIASLAFHPTDRLLVIASYNEVLFWDWSCSEPFAKTSTVNEKEKVRFVAFDPLGHKLLTGVANAPARIESQWNRAPVPPTPPPPPPQPSAFQNDYERRILMCYRFMVQQYEQLVQRYRWLIRGHGGSSSSIGDSMNINSYTDSGRRRPSRNIRRFRLGFPLPPRSNPQPEVTRFRPIFRTRAERRQSLFLASRLRNGLNLTPPAQQPAEETPSNGAAMQRFESEITEALGRLHRNIRRMRIHGMDMPWTSSSERPSSNSNVDIFSVSTDSVDTSDSDIEDMSLPINNLTRGSRLASLSPESRGAGSPSGSARITVVPNLSSQSWQGDSFLDSIQSSAQDFFNRRTPPTTPRSQTNRATSPIDHDADAFENISLPLDSDSAPLPRRDPTLPINPDVFENLSLPIDTGVFANAPLSLDSDTFENPAMSLDTDPFESVTLPIDPDQFENDTLTTGSDPFESVPLTTDSIEQFETAPIPESLEGAPLPPRDGDIFEDVPLPQNLDDLEDAPNVEQGPRRTSQFDSNISSTRVPPQVQPSDVSTSSHSRLTVERSSPINVPSRNHPRMTVESTSPTPMNLSSQPTSRLNYRYTVFELSNTIAATAEVNEPTPEMIQQTTNDIRRFFNVILATYNSSLNRLMESFKVRCSSMTRDFSNNTLREIISFGRKVFMACVMCRARMLHLERNDIELLWFRIAQSLVRFAQYPIQQTSDSVQLFRNVSLSGRMLEISFEMMANSTNFHDERIFELHRSWSDNRSSVQSFTAARDLLQRIFARHSRWVDHSISSAFDEPFRFGERVRSVIPYETLFRARLTRLATQSYEGPNSTVLDIQEEFDRSINEMFGLPPPQAPDQPLSSELLQQAIHHFSNLSLRVEAAAYRTRCDIQQNNLRLDHPLRMDHVHRPLSDSDDDQPSTSLGSRFSQLGRRSSSLSQNQDSIFRSLQQRRFRTEPRRHNQSLSFDDDDLATTNNGDSDNDDQDDDSDPGPSSAPLPTDTASTSDLLKRMKALASRTESEMSTVTDPNQPSTSSARTSSEHSSFSNIMQSVREFIGQLETLVSTSNSSSAAATPTSPPEDQNESSSSSSTSSSSTSTSPASSFLTSSSSSLPSASSTPSTPVPSADNKRKSFTPTKAFSFFKRQKTDTVNSQDTPSTSNDTPSTSRATQNEDTACACESSGSPPDWFRIAANSSSSSTNLFCDRSLKRPSNIDPSLGESSATPTRQTPNTSSSSSSSSQSATRKQTKSLDRRDHRRRRSPNSHRSRFLSTMSCDRATSPPQEESGPSSLPGTSSSSGQNRPDSSTPRSILKNRNLFYSNPFLSSTSSPTLSNRIQINTNLRPSSTGCSRLSAERRPPPRDTTSSSRDTRFSRSLSHVRFSGRNVFTEEANRPDRTEVWRRMFGTPVRLAFLPYQVRTTSSSNSTNRSQSNPTSPVTTPSPLSRTETPPSRYHRSNLTFIREPLRKTPTIPPLDNRTNPTTPFRSQTSRSRTSLFLYKRLRTPTSSSNTPSRSSTPGSSRRDLTDRDRLHQLQFRILRQQISNRAAARSLETIAPSGSRDRRSTFLHSNSSGSSSTRRLRVGPRSSSSGSPSIRVTPPWRPPSRSTPTSSGTTSQNQTSPSTSRNTRQSSTQPSPESSQRRTDRDRLEDARGKARRILAMMLRHISSFFHNESLMDIPAIASNLRENHFFQERVYHLHRLLQLALYLTELLHAQLSLSRRLLHTLRESLESVSHLRRYLRTRQGQNSSRSRNSSLSTTDSSAGGIQAPTFRPASAVPISIPVSESYPSNFLPLPIFRAEQSVPAVQLNNLPILVNGPNFNTQRSGRTAERSLSPTSLTWQHQRSAQFIPSGAGEEDNEEPEREWRSNFNSNVFFMRGAYGPNSILVPDSYYSPHHRIQAWDFSRFMIPDITDPKKNIVVKECKIHNDASVDIAKDGQILVTLLPAGRLSVTTMLGVYSLKWDSLGQCLYTTTFELNAVSVSLSPTSRHLIVGLASRRVRTSFSDTHTVAQIFRLDGRNIKKDDENPELGKMTRLRRIELPRDTGYMSLNCIRWAPNPGQGLVYGTNTGLLRILE